MDLDEDSESDFYGKCQKFKSSRDDSVFAFLISMILTR